MKTIQAHHEMKIVLVVSLSDSKKIKDHHDGRKNTKEHVNTNYLKFTALSTLTRPLDYREYLWEWMIVMRAFFEDFIWETVGIGKSTKDSHYLEESVTKYLIHYKMNI